jgi:hypothetical protein
MDILKMLEEMRAERAQVEEAILVLQRLASGQGKRRGRPPKWMTSAGSEGTDTTPKRKRKGFSAATRAKMAEAQRKRWAEKKKAAS